MIVVCSRVTEKELSYRAFPFNAAKTHAHIDHSELLLKLVKAGFASPIYTTGATDGSVLGDAAGFGLDLGVRSRTPESPKRQARKAARASGLYSGRGQGMPHAIQARDIS
jgi:hypothetical protein